MSNNRYWIGHCYDKININDRKGSDKVYILTLIEQGNDFVVDAHYGKRTIKNLIKQEKYKGTYEVALQKFKDLISKREKKGYINIETTLYSGTTSIPSSARVKTADLLSVVKDAMDDVQKAEETLEEKSKKDKMTFREKVADSLEMKVEDINSDTWFAAKCINNNGRENMTLGVEYMAHFDSIDSMIIVIDDSGDENRYRKTRFEIVK